MSNSTTTTFRPSFGTCKTGVTALCPVTATVYGNYFNTGACAFFLALFTLCLIGQIFLGIKGKTRSFSIFVCLGVSWEIMGYGARLSMSNVGGLTVWSYPAFVIQLLMLILAPTMIAAGIAVTFKWIVLYLDPRYSLLRPKLYPWVFVATDFISIVIQAAGGGLSASVNNDTPSGRDLVNIAKWLLVAGCAFQALNMVVSGGFMAVYWARYRAGKKRGDVLEGIRAEESRHGKEDQGKRERRFKLFILALIVAYVAVLIRCIYRIPEMAGGWGSARMRDETAFLILDGAMVALASVLLTIFHPTYYFPILGNRNRGIIGGDKYGEEHVMMER